jgi:very-short-patch-repair endonuclease
MPVDFYGIRSDRSEVLRSFQLAIGGNPASSERRRFTGRASRRCGGSGGTSWEGVDVNGDPFLSPLRGKVRIGSMDRIRTRARELRNNPTDAERVLWGHLRFWQLDGCKFRRQQPLGRYIVDFVCLEKRVVVEVDGGQHAQQPGPAAERDRWLRDEGFVVLRFWNHDVLKNINAIKELVYKTLRSTPYLNPSPQGGRRQRARAKRSSQNLF